MSALSYIVGSCEPNKEIGFRELPEIVRTEDDVFGADITDLKLVMDGSIVLLVPIDNNNFSDVSVADACRVLKSKHSEKISVTSFKGDSLVVRNFHKLIASQKDNGIYELNYVPFESEVNDADFVVLVFVCDGSELKIRRVKHSVYMKFERGLK